MVQETGSREVEGPLTPERLGDPRLGLTECGMSVKVCGVLLTVGEAQVAEQQLVQPAA
jgi:hypothetical protein